MSGKPVRLTLSRRAGFNLQRLSLEMNGLPAVNVARPSKWGNPFIVGATEHLGCRFASGPLTAKRAVELYRAYRQGRFPNLGELAELRGKNLACFCKDGPCHADVLLELANPLSEDSETCR